MAIKRASMFWALLAITCVLRCEASSAGLARRMAMDDHDMANMTTGSMDDLKGSNLVSADGTKTYNVASKSLARQAYPWCRTAVTTAYFLQPNITTVAHVPGSKYTEYEFRMDEDFGMCKEVQATKGKSKAACKTPFYSFMMSVSDECHEAIMSVKTVQMYSRQDVAGAQNVEMYAHAHKGHDTGVPLLKYLIKPDSLSPSEAPGATRRFVITVRINQRDDNMCEDLETLCGGNTCMVALSDEEYETCPAYFARMKK